jgi:SagB-type dehydrogenase family enzyme
MKRRELFAALAATAIAEASCGRAQERQAPDSEALESQPPKSQAPEHQAGYANESALPKPNLAGGVSLEDAIQRRRSMRRFAPRQLPVETVGQLLWAGQGVTSDNGRRAAPSAGALYALELYAVTAGEVMHYLPQGHRAETRASPDLRPQLRALALDQASVGAAPAVIVVAAEYARLSQRYGGRADAYANLEAAHATQNMLLQATALGLGAVPIAAVDGGGSARALALPSAQTVVYLIPVGYPA